MRWPVFALWNALGGIAWATTVGVLAYVVGHAAEQLVRRAGLAGLAALAVLAIALSIRRRVRRSRRPAPDLDAVP